MTLRSYINFLTIAIWLLNTFTSCESSKRKRTEKIANNNNNIWFDTSKTAIILFDKKFTYPFDNSYKPAKLTKDDIKNLDSLVIACVTEHNNSVNKGHKGLSIDLKKYNYYRQLIVVINTKGEKEVWVNCFCNIWSSDNWKTEIISVDDGGNCYFNLKINLTNNIFYDLGINGMA